MQSTERPGNQPLHGLSVDWLAEACGTPGDLLWALARDSGQMYKPPREQKKWSGGVRVIDPPVARYKRLLRRMNRVLSEAVGVHEAWHGGVKRRSSFTSARKHLGKPFLVTRDVRECFSSIGPKDLFRAFTRVGADAAFATFLSGIMTVRGRIPQGGPLSNLAVNLFFLRQDGHLLNVAKARGAGYSRLTDDFVVSTKSRADAVAIGREIDQQIEGRGLRISGRKRFEKGLLPGHRRKEIHSLIVNSRRGVRLKRPHVQEAMAITEKYARRCACATPSDIRLLAALRERVSGWIYYMRQADESPARHIARMQSLADSKVLSMLRAKGLCPHKGKWWTRSEAARLPAAWEKLTSRAVA